MVRRGDLWLIAPSWILWDSNPSLACTFTHDQAIRWCESYNGSAYASQDGPPEAVAVYVRATDWTDEDPGNCIHCGQAYELVRPGKSQPTCTCNEVEA